MVCLSRLNFTAAKFYTTEAELTRTVQLRVILPWSFKYNAVELLSSWKLCNFGNSSCQPLISCSNLILAATWPRVDSLMVADSENYSDLDPLSAPQWHLRADFEDRPACNLCEFSSLMVCAIWNCYPFFLTLQGTPWGSTWSCVRGTRPWTICFLFVEKVSDC